MPNWMLASLSMSGVNSHRGLASVIATQFRTNRPRSAGRSYKRPVAGSRLGLLSPSKADGLATGGVFFRLSRGWDVVELLPILLGEQPNRSTALGAIRGVDTHQVGDVLVTFGAEFVVVVKVDGLQGTSGSRGSGKGSDLRQTAHEPSDSDGWRNTVPCLRLPSRHVQKSERSKLEGTRLFLRSGLGGSRAVKLLSALIQTATH
ncbi:MAG: hypothetical protein ACI9X4_001032 [Glaciecola sp.]|jgi:hypothetical protein